MIDLGKILAVDFGKVRLGLATGHVSARMAFPLMVLKNRGGELAYLDILNLCKSNSCGTVLFGLPVDLRRSGSTNQTLELVNKFIDGFKRFLIDSEDPENREIGVQVFDESLSSFEASDRHREQIGALGYKKALGLDAYAAQVILQRYFDSLD